MKRTAESALILTAVAGLVLAFCVASPAFRASGTFGLAQAADSTPAAASPAAASPNAGSTDSSATPAEDLSYHRESYEYASGELRDPFGSLLKGRFVAEGDARLPDVGSIDLLGVMWGEADKFAIVETKEGQGYVLRVGDPVVNGEVAGITRDSVTIRQYFFGTSTTVTLKLKPREVNADAKFHSR